MELALIKRIKSANIPGTLSIFSAIVALLYFNIEYLTKISTPFSPYIFFILTSIFSGIIGLFMKKNRLYALWGLGIGIFLIIHTVLMIIFTLTINYKP